MTWEKTFHLGNVLDPTALRDPDAVSLGDPVNLPWEALRVHALCTGSSGSGKSRTATALALDAFDQNLPTVVIDKHGDTVEDIAAHIAARAMKRDAEGKSTLLRRLHFLEWSPSYCPRLDPFHFPLPEGTHPDFVCNTLTAAGESLVDQVAGHLQSSTQGTEGFEGTPRLLRQLKNGLLGCVRPAPKRRLPFGLVSTLLNVLHPRHLSLFGQVASTLPSSTRADFAHLHELRPEKAFEQIESALNRTTAFFSSLLRESFGETSETAAVLDLGSVIRKGHMVLVNLRETPYFSHAQGVTLGRLLSSSVVETLMRLPREQRTAGCLLMIEEAGEIIHEPFLRYLGAVRKYGCRMVFCGQDLSTFVKPNVNLVPKLLSQVGLVICFNQRYPDDASMLSQLLFQASVDRTPLVHEVEREGPLQWLQLEDSSQGGQSSLAQSKGSAMSDGVIDTDQETRTKAKQAGWSEQQSTQIGDAQGEVTGQARATGKGQGEAMAPVQKGKDFDDRRTVTSQQNDSQTDTSQRSHTATRTHGDATGTSGSETDTVGHGTAKGRSHESSENENLTLSIGDNWSVSKRWVHLATKIRELQATGQLEHGPTNEQLAAFQAMLMELPPRLAIVKQQGQRALFIRTRDMPNAFLSPVALARSIEWLKHKMLQLHPYLFFPDLSPDREDARIRAFLEQAVPASEDSDEDPMPEPDAEDIASPWDI